tara:strand:- start:1296 stop:2747 length:1452 start_codon:yes stop_codon:yes gene_type:complete
MKYNGKYSIQKIWDELTSSPNSINEASYEGPSNSNSSQLKDFLDSLPTPVKDAANEDIKVGGSQRGYTWEVQLMKGIEKARQTMVGGTGGIGALSAKTQKVTQLKTKVKKETKSTKDFDISLDNNPNPSGGLHVNDGSGTNRFATVECKLIPSQFGQFKKGQVKTLEFNGTDLVWVHKSETTASEAQKIDIVFNKVNTDTKVWFVQFLQYLNSEMQSAHTAIPEFSRRRLQPLQGHLDSINLKSSIYEQLGKTYTFGSNQGSISDQSIDQATAFFIMKKGDINSDGLKSAPAGLGTSSEVNAGDWVEYLSKTKDYLIMGSTVRPTDPPPGCVGSIFATGSKGTSMGFPQFKFPGTVSLSCRFTADKGTFRMEAKGNLEGIPSNGRRFNNELELYNILLEMNPAFLSDFNAVDNAVQAVTGGYKPEFTNSGVRGEKGKEISSGGLQARLAKMGSQKYDHHGLTDKIYDHRERKYSIASKLFSKN